MCHRWLTNRRLHREVMNGLSERAENAEGTDRVTMGTADVLDIRLSRALQEYILREERWKRQVSAAEGLVAWLEEHYTGSDRPSLREHLDEYYESAAWGWPWSPSWEKIPGEWREVHCHDESFVVAYVPDGPYDQWLSLKGEPVYRRDVGAT